MFWVGEKMVNMMKKDELCSGINYLLFPEANVKAEKQDLLLLLQNEKDKGQPGRLCLASLATW